MENRTAIISGVISGIGKATVFELLKNGFFVASFASDAKVIGFALQLEESVTFPEIGIKYI